MADKQVLFYSLEGKDWRGQDLERFRSHTSEFRTSFWKPSPSHIWPPGRKDPRVAAYSAMSLTGLFRNRCYSMVRLQDEAGETAHSSLLMPPFARFPFMNDLDLQIGATYTRPTARGRGLAVRAIHEAIDHFGSERTYWYLTEAHNHASISVIERAGFERYGTGRKVPKLWLKALGYYQIETRTNT